MDVPAGLLKPGILKQDHSENPRSPPLAIKNDSNAQEIKSVSIASGKEIISPLILGASKDINEPPLDGTRSPRPIRARKLLTKRLTGRPPSVRASSVDDSLDFHDHESNTTDGEHHLFNSGLVGKISQWIREEKNKRDLRRQDHHSNLHPSHAVFDRPTSKRDSGDSVDFETLEQLIKESFPFGRKLARKLSSSGRHRPSLRRSRQSSTHSTVGSSDTEYTDGELFVPSAEVSLDNTRTLSYPDAAEMSHNKTLLPGERQMEVAWATFKLEILRLTHTLQLKGWRRVPMDLSPEIKVERLSGALTNAVYVVSPPHDLPSPRVRASDTDQAPRPTRKPAKLLLRIYGPQAEHLIDRESELQVLRRLARKHIGPRMLGTFQNGRFEEYFNACPLTPAELRNPDTSRHIAKRMRELHDGIDLLDSERRDGPFVWKNWDKWLARVQRIVLWFDDKSDVDSTLKSGLICGTKWAMFLATVNKYRMWLEQQVGGHEALSGQLIFSHNDTQYGNILRVMPSVTSPLILPSNSHKQLIVIDFEYASANTPGLEFANHFTEWCYNYHDSTGPWRCSHQLYPSIEEQERFIKAYIKHKPHVQSQNATPALEGLDTVPESQHTSEEIERALQNSDEKSFQYFGASSSQSISKNKHRGSTHSLSSLLHDARTPASAHSPVSMTFDSSASSHRNSSLSAEEEQAYVAYLLAQTRLWRMANSAQWVAWGIVQAKMTGLPNEEDTPLTKTSDMKDVDSLRQLRDEDEGVKAYEKENDAERTEDVLELNQNKQEEKEEEEFDYLAYARDRAMLFWGDAVSLGFVKLSELPEDVQRDIKIVDH